MAKSNIFELNGKAYDARTGAMLGDAKRVQHTAKVAPMQPKPVPHHLTGASVDGFVAPAARAKAGVKHVAAHRPQPTKTLMRRAVKPPVVTAVKHPAALQSQSPLQAQSRVPAHLAVKPKLSSDVVDPLRASRAKTAGRSQAVQHFKPATHAHAKPAAFAMPAAAQPMQPAAHSGLKIIHPPAASRAQSVRPVQDFRRQHAASAIPARRHQPATAVTRAQAQPRTHATAAPDRLDDAAYEQDLFEQALAQATSHEQPAPHESAMDSIKRKTRRRRQALGIVASLSVFVLLFGFIAWQNRDEIKLQIASARAGFSASTPLYTPEGYDLGKLSYAPGAVSVLYQHGNKDQGFSVSQKKSNWDSQTLLENFVATSGEDYQGYQSNGRTVYIYGDGQATWVNGGIWYQIKDTSSLEDEQLVKIAASM